MVKWVTINNLINYCDGITIMEKQLEKIIQLLEPDTIFLLEHNETYTAGRSSTECELLVKDRFPVVYTDRGGKFTYHGPGQRVIYPIINLNNGLKEKDLKLYIRKLEKWIILTLESLQVQAFTIPSKIGVWVKNTDNVNAKIGAIGIRIKKWVVYHGVAINIYPNLEHYSDIIPCGISDSPVTSLKDIGVNISLKEFDFLLKKFFPGFYCY